MIVFGFLKSFSSIFHLYYAYQFYVWRTEENTETSALKVTYNITDNNITLKCVLVQNTHKIYSNNSVNIRVHAKNIPNFIISIVCTRTCFFIIRTTFVSIKYYMIQICNLLPRMFWIRFNLIIFKPFMFLIYILLRYVCTS